MDYNPSEFEPSQPQRPEDDDSTEYEDENDDYARFAPSTPPTEGLDDTAQVEANSLDDTAQVMPPDYLTDTPRTVPPVPQQPSLDEDDPDSNARGRARERQRRRKEREHMVRRTGEVYGTRTGSRKTDKVPRVRPAGGFKMPDIPIPNINWRVALSVLGAIILVPSLLLFLRFLRNDPATIEPNALWIGTEWTYEIHEPEAIEELAQRLRANRIGNVYAWVSWYQGDGTWRGTDNFTNVQMFVEQFKDVYPETVLYGWVSLPVELNGEYRLEDEAVQQAIADFSATVVAETGMGFDGVFLNIEPVWTGDENFLELLRKVRASVGDDVPISVAIPPDWSPEDADIPVPPLIVPGTIWEKEYKQNVALLSDEMALMAYNSGLDNATDYETWMAYQVSTYAQALAEIEVDTDIVVGIPTYDAEPPGHFPDAENVETALRGIRIGLLQAEEAAPFVRGVALYAGWTTDETEWAQFRTGWIDE